ncbi:MAG: penicillin acylase family protein [Pseudomonadota bacterium]
MTALRATLRWALYIVLLAAMLVGAFIAVQWWRGASAQPVFSGDVEAPALAAEASLSRDENAAVYIRAANELDALYALGFAHAQDRLWQMDLVRRAATGRMSEVFGSVTLGYDAFMRHFEFGALVKDSWASFSAADKARVEAYSNGVNAYLQSPLYNRPAEHIWLMSNPQAWRPTDSLLVAKMLWPNLSNNLFEEFTRARLTVSAGAPVAQAFIRPYPKEAHVAMAWPDLARTLGLPTDTPASAPRVNLNLSPARENSNNWAVAGSRSVSGKPMLANDPHLGLTMPGFWYLAHMNMGGRMAAGATIPGIPAVVVGHNAAMAWGPTNAHDSDVQDVYREQLKPRQPAQYRTADGWAPFEFRDETIKVRFGDPVTRRYRKTVRGPVLEPGALPVPLPRDDAGVYSLAWTALDSPDLTLSAIMAMSRARDVEGIKKAADLFAGPPQNIAYAGRNGDIGLIVVGKVPIRSRAHQTLGAMPSDGWLEGNQWQGMIPQHLTPHVSNPAAGALVTANARVVPDEYPYLRSVDAADPSRQERIATLLQAKKRHDLDSFSAIQLDTYAPVIEQLLPALIETRAADEDAAEALAYVEDWSGDWSAAGPGPVIFAQWVSLLTQALTWDELGEIAPDFTRVSMRRLADILSGPLGHWCDDRRTMEQAETCDLIQSETLSAAAAALKRQHGTLAGLQWADIHRDTHGHLGLGAIPFIGDMLSRKTSRPAGPGAPNVAGLRADSLPNAAGGGFGPSLRFLIDLAQPENAKFMISSGQSGHFNSPHYDDLQRKWMAGAYITFDPNQSDPGKTIRFLARRMD